MNSTAFLTPPLNFYVELSLHRLQPSPAIRSKAFEGPQSATHTYPTFLPVRTLAELQCDLQSLRSSHTPVLRAFA